MLFLFFLQINAQDNDSIKAGVDLGKIEVPNPQSIVEAYTYDVTTDRYIYTNTFDGFNVNYPLVLTPKQYQELVLREEMRKYYREKSAAVDGKKEGSEEKKKDLLPRYYVNSKFFESIFGSNTIDIKPTGSVEIDLGLRYTKQDNPAFSPRNRVTTTFDFDQRISVGLQGKVGTRLNVNINYDTQSTFAFQNLIKLEYGSTEDDILQKLEIGNVSFPLSNSLIRGSQSLFGVKAQFQFGKTTVTGVFSEQKSQTKTVTSQGGGTLQDFQLFAQEYDSDKHYFLSQYFRDKYDKSLETYPYINSRVQITRIEVWVTNKQNRINSNENNLRNLIALQDIGEAPLSNLLPQEVVGVNLTSNPNFFNAVAPDSPADNANNKFNPNKIGTNFLKPAIREVATANNGFTIGVDEGLDYAKLENARKLTASEFTYHPQLGYISLNQRLANDEVLGVAYQYTVGDKVYQVGEFGTDGVDATQVNNSGVPSSQALIVKLLKSNLTAVKQKAPNDPLTMPTWNLMMKNIYQIPGGYQLQQEDFKFNILYTDPSPLNYITAANSGSPLPADVKDTPLLKVLNVDKLNYTNDPQDGGDGFFDFIPGTTIDTQYGRIIFTTKEPFGELMFKKLNTSASEDYNNPLTYNDNQSKYVFRTLYRSTQAAALQESEKNKFQLRGRFKSSGGDGISIGAFNVPQGSVVVKSGGRILVEGVDYTVNYQLGKVQLLDPSLQASNTPIEISVENNSVFGQQTKRFWGVNVEHQFNKNFLVGGTILNLSERPFTNKSNYGQESVNNTIVGLNTNFSTEVPLLTRLVNKLPNIDTDVPSNLSFRGEIAYLLPGASKADQFNGEATTYVDDFEGSQSSIDLRSPLSWDLASVPLEGNFDGNPDTTEPPTDVRNVGYKRAKLSWYTIDPLFYTQPPSGINNDDLSLNRTRRIFSRELFPNVDIAQGNSNVISTLDLTYYPKDRGPYNYNPAIAATNQFSEVDAPDNWAGIMRSINSTNFEQSNVEYVQFWVLSPYSSETPDEADPNNIGKLVINLGEISEDILKDGRKQFENGLPEVGSTVPALQTEWAQVPSSQSLVYAFDTNEGNRNVQDVGYDGLNDAAEAAKFPDYATYNDPSADNYQFYLSATGDIVNRYRNYNNSEGNSPVNVTDTNRGNDTKPDVEDVNRDQTMNTINAYFKFEVPINSSPQVGQDYVVNIQNTTEQMPNGATVKAKWVQYKVPIQEFTADNQVGSITDFRSIRFMRMYMTGFKDEITLRFGSLELVRGEWRRYTGLLDSTPPDMDGTDDPNTGFDVVAVNIQENADREPIPYVSPPGVTREQLYNNNTVINQNEQSLSLRVYDKNGGYDDGLELGDSRAVFKNVSVDMRQFKKLRMFLHAEALPPGETQALENDEMIAFIRFGNDFTENFYQIEVPLKVTSQNAVSPDDIWPLENEIDLPLNLLTKLKILKLNNDSTIQFDVNGIGFIEEQTANNKLKLGIKGNPNFGLVRTLMVGVKNNSDRVIRGEVWFNELRLSDLDNKGGYAAVANLDTNMADFATLSATSRVSTIGFGGIEEGPNERSREDVFQYDIVTNFNLGKLLPKKWGITLPFNYAVGEETITPKYDPFYQDIELQQIIDNTDDEAKKDEVKNRAIDYTKRTSINFIGVRKERGEEQKQHFYDVENLTLSYSFNTTEHHDYEIESLLDQQNRTTVDYAYAFKPKTIEPFKNSKKLSKSGYYKLLKDFNFNFMPANVSFSSNIIRQFNRQQFRLVDVEGIGLDPLYRRNYFFNYQYGFNYNITKSLRVNYTAATSNIVRNYLDESNVPIDGLDIWDDYWNVGESNQHNQQIVVNYDLPINKIPALSFVKSNYSYTGDFNWQRSSDAFSTIEAENGVEYQLGNTIQNANSHKLNTTFNMDLLYRYIGLTGNKKKKNKNKKEGDKGSKTSLPKPGQKITAKGKTTKNDGNILVNGLIGLVTSVKNIQANYTQTSGTVLPGYLPGLGFFGSSKPSLGFVFGSQSDVRYEAARQGWLTTFPEFNQNFTQVVNKQLNFTAQVEPFSDLKIDLIADRMYSENYSEQYDVSNSEYNSRSPYNFGNFNISTILIKTAFTESNENFSETFQDFRDNRILVADKLAQDHYGSNNYPRDIEGYPVGFGKNSQQVLLPSFRAAYSGKDVSKESNGVFKNIPLPNWNLKYTGLMRYKWFKEKFKRFSLQHGYRASYNVNSFRSNLNEAPVDANGNFYASTIISNVNLTEQFNPLLRVDFEMKNSIKIIAEMKKDRTLNMSFDNNLLTEVSGNEYTIGLGYRIKNVTINSSLADNPTGVIKSDINIKTDFSLRKNNTIVRYLDYNNNELAGGQDLWSIKLSADYSFSKNLTAIFFYDHQFSQAVISTSFPITNIRTGFTIRYNFGN
ncbi:cell surface protein SprA [Flavobacterium jejuense]|uniref:Cell surface protein SprA n=1 Tax=Flavobacterium jejuense TaxID=1544455 RepID=A0ABX0IXJ3_9FLAO|nr:cell surface protein SprA [Flavobacterium jejuense]